MLHCLRFAKSHLTTSSCLFFTKSHTLLSLPHLPYLVIVEQGLIIFAQLLKVLLCCSICTTYTMCTVHYIYSALCLLLLTLQFLLIIHSVVLLHAHCCFQDYSCMETWILSCSGADFCCIPQCHFYVNLFFVHVMSSNSWQSIWWLIVKLHCQSLLLCLCVNVFLLNKFLNFCILLRHSHFALYAYCIICQ